MNLFSTKTFEDQNVKDVLDLIKKVILSGVEDNCFKISRLITYQEFKNKIRKFIERIMKILLEDTDYKNDKCIAIIFKFPNEFKGLYKGDNGKSTIIINESVVKKMYDGKIEEILFILHELNHFNINYSIMLGEVNEDLVRIIKERLIRLSSNDPLTPNEPNEYYDTNYYLFSEEVYADICAREDLKLILTKLSDEKEVQENIKQFFEQTFSKEIKRDKARYDIHTRDFRTNMNFNDFYLNFEEAFDILIQDNHKWLDIPQIALEYYLDNNTVKKRDATQLEELLKSSNKLQEQEYLRMLIDKSRKTNRTLN